MKHLNGDNYYDSNTPMFLTSPEVEKLKGQFQQQNGGTCLASVQSDDLNFAKEEVTHAHENLKVI